jgi:hypothetical protein
MVAGATAGGAAAATAPKWQAIPKAPISGRGFATTVWTGKEMVVWGGRSSTGDTNGAGAAYNPRTRTWRRIATVPPQVRQGAVAYSTGREIVAWASQTPAVPSATFGTAAYNPATNRWRRLPAGPLGLRESFKSVWTGKQLIVLGGNAGDQKATPTAAAFTPSTSRWHVLTGLDRLNPWPIFNGAVWDGRRVVVSGTRCATTCPPGFALTRFFAALDPATDTAVELDPRIADWGDTVIPVRWTGRNVVFEALGSATGTQGVTSIAFVKYRRTYSEGRVGPGGPCTVAGDFTQTAWLGQRFAAACGDNAIQIYRLASDKWRLIAPGPSAFNSRGGSAIVWTGRELIVWSGSLFTKGNPTPNDGASIALTP